jgi:hypothetical protein
MASAISLLTTSPNDLELAGASTHPGSRNPDKLANLLPGQGAEGRSRHKRSTADKMRRYLESGTKAARDEDGRTRFHRILDNMVDIASDRNHPDAVAAARLLFERAYGKPMPSEEEIDVIRSGGVQLVYVAAPDVPLAEERKPHPPLPDFLDAEFVEGSSPRW